MSRLCLRCDMTQRFLFPSLLSFFVIASNANNSTVDRAEFLIQNKKQLLSLNFEIDLEIKKKHTHRSIGKRINNAGVVVIYTISRNFLHSIVIVNVLVIICIVVVVCTWNSLARFCAHKCMRGRRSLWENRRNERYRALYEGPWRRDSCNHDSVRRSARRHIATFAVIITNNKQQQQQQ